jgi:hypothetical protein
VSILRPKVHRIDLATARTIPERLGLGPGHFLCAFLAEPLDRTATLTVRYDNPTAGEVDVRLGDVIRAPYNDIYFANAAQAGRAIWLLLADRGYEFWPGNPGLAPNGTFMFSPADAVTGADFSDGISMGAGSNWALKLLKVRFVTDANAANRLVGLSLLSNGNNVFNAQSPTIQGASEVLHYIWAVGTQLSFAPEAGLTHVGNAQMPLPDFTTPGAVEVQITVENIQAGDQLEDVVIVAEQW